MWLSYIYIYIIYIYIYIYIYIHVYTACCIYVNIYIWSFLHAFVVLCYLPKLKRGIVVVFSAGFLYAFSIKTFLTKYTTLSVDQVSTSDLISLKRYKTKSIFKLSFSPLMMS